MRIGGLDGAGLLAELQRAGVALNERALALLASPAFQDLVPQQTVVPGIDDVAGLGFAQGATWPELLAAAARRGWHPAPLALAPWLRGDQSDDLHVWDPADRLAFAID
ncbi:hypothetical protein CKO37_17165 [Rubrivivax gelatinosus]|nr:hypothetical protein [Rubrivivax gelatinosus]